jgi:hypothetical protein
LGEIEVQPDVAQNGLGFTDGRSRIWTTVGLRIEPLCVKKVIFNVANFANSVAIACVLALRVYDTKRNQDRCRNHYTRLSSHNASEKMIVRRKANLESFPSNAVTTNDASNRKRPQKIRVLRPFLMLTS